MEQQEKNEIRLELAGKVRQIIEQIQKHGFGAYAVGGCVRDSLLGRTPDDWDITTRGKAAGSQGNFSKDDRYGY